MTRKGSVANQSKCLYEFGKIYLFPRVKA